MLFKLFFGLVSQFGLFPHRFSADPFLAGIADAAFDQGHRLAAQHALFFLRLHDY